MKFLNLLLVIFALGMFSSCGDDGDCIASDWIGTYDLDPSTEDCASPDLSISPTITITAGASANTVSFDGLEAEVSGCSISYADPIFGISGDAELDGDRITVSVLGCTGTFIRQ